jgi:hypothetical protein
MRNISKIVALSVAIPLLTAAIASSSFAQGGGGSSGGSSSGGASAGGAAAGAASGPSRTNSAVGSPNAGAAGAGSSAVSGVPNGPGNAAGLNNSINDPSGAGNSDKLPTTPTPQQGTVGLANPAPSPRSPATSSQSQERARGNRTNPEEAAVPGTSGSPAADSALRSNGTTMPGPARQTATKDRDSDAAIDEENRRLDRTVGSICKGC